MYSAQFLNKRRIVDDRHSTTLLECDKKQLKPTVIASMEMKNEN